MELALVSIIISLVAIIISSWSRKETIKLIYSRNLKRLRKK